MSWFIELFRSATFGRVQVAGSGGEGITGVAFETTPPTLPDAELFALATVFSLLVFSVGYVFFNRLALTFAKEV